MRLATSVLRKISKRGTKVRRAFVVWPVYSWGISLPGFIKLCGSSARLIARITSSASPCSSQILQLADADAVLAGARAAEPQRPLHQARVGRFHPRHLLGVVGVDHEDQMEVAVAGVADERRDDVRGADRPASRGCTPRAARSARRHRRSTAWRRAATPSSRRARCGAPARASRDLPASMPPLKSSAAVLGGDLLDRTGLLVHRCLADAVELEEQRRRQRDRSSSSD